MKSELTNFTEPQRKMLQWGVVHLAATLGLFFFLPPLWVVFIIGYFWLFSTFTISIPLIMLSKWLISRNLTNDLIRDYSLGIFLALPMIFIGVSSHAPPNFAYIALTYHIFTEGQNVSIRRALDEAVEFAGFGTAYIIFLIYTLVV